MHQKSKRTTATRSVWPAMDSLSWKQRTSTAWASKPVNPWWLHPCSRISSSTAEGTSIDLESNPPELLKVDEGCPTHWEDMAEEQMKETEASFSAMQPHPRFVTKLINFVYPICHLYATYSLQSSEYKSRWQIQLTCYTHAGDQKKWSRTGESKPRRKSRGRWTKTTRTKVANFINIKNKVRSVVQCRQVNQNDGGYTIYLKRLHSLKSWDYRMRSSCGIISEWSIC